MELQENRTRKVDLHVSPYTGKAETFVETVVLLPSQIKPDVVLWGDRVFMRHSDIGPKRHPVYVEVRAEVATVTEEQFDREQA